MINEFVNSLFLMFDDENFEFPSNFPLKLYSKSDNRTQKFTKKWAVILSILGDYSGSNNLKDVLNFWNEKHPNYRTSLKSYYRNKARYEKGGWESFFVFHHKKITSKNKVEPPLNYEELKQVRVLLKKLKPKLEETA